MSPELTPILVGLLALAGGALAYVLPRWPWRALGLALLAGAAGLATVRHAGIVPGLEVAAAGLLLIVVALLPPRGAVDEPADHLGLSLRLLLMGFAATATLALALNRPLGGSGALDLDLVWYWAAAVGCLLLLGEREPAPLGLGGALLSSALALLSLDLLPTAALPALRLAPPLALALVARWVGRR